MSPLPKLTRVDGYRTATSSLQHDTEETLLKHLPNHPLHSKESTEEDQKSQTPSTVLNRQGHVQFLARNLLQGFSSRYISQDASQPWLMFWTLQAFSCLGVALDRGNSQRIIDKVLTWQHPDGGFGGGPGQAAHLLTTYASVCTLAIAGRPGSGGGWESIDRKRIYDFFMSLKQKDGSFLVAHHAEVDVRGIYCLLVVAILLDIITPELVDGTAEFIASCQTYEGGFASASFHDPRGFRSALGEAHGGYTFCALASWVLLQPYLNATIPDPSLRPSIDLKRLTRWLVQMQGSESEIGGFKGRTNKLVDGCYSWWCGGAFALLEALGVGGIANAKSVPDEVVDQEEKIVEDIKGEGDDWMDFDDALYNSKALQEYILFAGQSPSGGLRDKPPKPADSYHTLYCLSGLSSAQHHIFPSKSKKQAYLETWSKAEESSGSPNRRAVDLGVEESDIHQVIRRESLVALLSWTEDPLYSKTFGHIVGGKANRLNATHPITNLTVTHTEGITKWAYGR